MKKILFCLFCFFYFFSYGQELVIKIDYNANFDDMIVRGGYVEVDRDINEKKFPKDSVALDSSCCVCDIFVKIFYFPNNCSTIDIIETMEDSGYRPASLLELLFFGEAYPNLQKTFPIVALGSISSGGRVAFLDFITFGRILNTIKADHKWSNQSFLAIKVNNDGPENEN
ncbi:MAG TPA: hypothetical protein PK142_00620 [bacterium]|nr:hypothetical protein [bacterium]